MPDWISQEEEVEQLKAEVGRLREIVSRIEPAITCATRLDERDQYGRDCSQGPYYCLLCHALFYKDEPHTDECLIAEAEAALEEPKA